MKISRFHFTVFPLVMLAAVLLSACQNTSSGRPSSVGASSPIVIEAIDGVPPALQTGLRDGLAQGASKNGLTLTDHTDRAKLHLHGYMHVERKNNEFEGFLVFDIFDADENRLQRLTSSIKRHQSSGLSAESMMTSTEITQLGETAMQDVATYLAR